MFSLAPSQAIQVQAADAPVSNRLYLWMEVLIGIAEVRMRMTSAKSTLYEPKSPHWRNANCSASSIPLVSVWHSQVGIVNYGHGAMGFGSPSFSLALHACDIICQIACWLTALLSRSMEERIVHVVE